MTKHGGIPYSRQKKKTNHNEDIKSKVSPLIGNNLFSNDNLQSLSEFIMLAFAKRRDKLTLDELLTNFILLCTEINFSEV